MLAGPAEAEVVNDSRGFAKRAGELVSLEDGDFMSQLLVDRFEALDFLAHGVDLGKQLHSLFGQAAQLFRRHLVEIGRGSHGADCVRAGRQQR